MSDKSKPIKLLVLGATGMLGNAVLRFFADSPGYEVSASARTSSGIRLLREDLRDRVHSGIDVENVDSLVKLFERLKPDVVVNCIGLVKQMADAEDPLAAVPINTMLPHRLARLCALTGARLVHMSTDCVFSGRKGRYLESDLPDALDVYGRSKLMGEVINVADAVTLRTSIIGHELSGSHGLINWFLAQSGSVKGYRQAIFSGFPTVEIARIIRDYVIPYPALSGLYQVSAEPIDKCTLLELVAKQYGVSTQIVPDDLVAIDRSLDSTRFREACGYQPPSWHELVERMHAFN